MKHWMITLALWISATPLAAVAEDFTNAKIGTIVIELREIDDAADATSVFKVSKTCKTHAGKDAKTELVLDWKAVCDWRKPVWNKETDTLTLNYSVSETDKKTFQAQCTGHKARDLNLREMCAEVAAEPAR